MASEHIWKALRGVQFSKEFKRKELLSVKGRTKASIHGGGPVYLVVMACRGLLAGALVRPFHRQSDI